MTVHTISQAVEILDQNARLFKYVEICSLEIVNFRFISSLDGLETFLADKIY